MTAARQPNAWACSGKWTQGLSCGAAFTLLAGLGQELVSSYSSTFCSFFPAQAPCWVPRGERRRQPADHPPGDEDPHVPCHAGGGVEVRGAFSQEGTRGLARIQRKVCKTVPPTFLTCEIGQFVAVGPRVELTPAFLLQPEAHCPRRAVSGVPGGGQPTGHWAWPAAAAGQALRPVFLAPTPAGSHVAPAHGRLEAGLSALCLGLRPGPDEIMGAQAGHGAVLGQEVQRPTLCSLERTCALTSCLSFAHHLEGGTPARLLPPEAWQVWQRRRLGPGRRPAARCLRAAENVAEWLYLCICCTERTCIIDACLQICLFVFIFMSQCSSWPACRARTGLSQGRRGAGCAVSGLQASLASGK
ncbi:PREDICTED: uncharacterized protein LOC105853573 [Condylura cristata]|uniref:uncharacterized protein LOC105853573 n=1 Tax=Condylura cristata TaxID=143302 RepID=UPI0006433F65|nr:PREDICTED: uncharacterized protein LOC105853573 [Condylura cristata]